MLSEEAKAHPDACPMGSTGGRERKVAGKADRVAKKAVVVAGGVQRVAGEIDHVGVVFVVGRGGPVHALAALGVDVGSPPESGRGKEHRAHLLQALPLCQSVAVGAPAVGAGGKGQVGRQRDIVGQEQQPFGLTHHAGGTEAVGPGPQEKEVAPFLHAHGAPAVAERLAPVVEGRIVQVVLGGVAGIVARPPTKQAAIVQLAGLEAMPVGSQVAWGKLHPGAVAYGKVRTHRHLRRPATAGNRHKKKNG